MRFRPCIDIHNGQVKQIVGGSLADEGDQARENYVSGKDGAWYAKLYQSDGLLGGHIILLNPKTSEYYGRTKEQALGALRAYPGGMQLGGGIDPDNAGEFLDAGASHVIVTSYVFRDGEIYYENLRRLRERVGRERLVLDVSCRRRGDRYYVVTDRWQKFAKVEMNEALMDRLSPYCSEFLVHAVDVEGKASGIEEDVARLLGRVRGLPVTYAGGVSDYEDLEKLWELGEGQVDVTIGSALSLFGGRLDYREVLRRVQSLGQAGERR